jgi:hypothetical protein
LLKRDGVRILVSELTDVQFKVELEFFVALLAFERVVVQLNSVEAKGEHWWKAADALAHELSGFRLTGLALDAIEFFKAKQFFQRLLNAFLALYCQHQI